MNIERQVDGNYAVTFKTQHGTEGRVELPVTNEEDAAKMVADMKVKDLETVSGIVDLTHQVVTQIVAGKQVSLMEAIEQWRAHTESVNLFAPTTIRVTYIMLKSWANESGLKDKPITSINPHHINAYVNSGGVRIATANRRLTSCRQLFTFCQELGISVRNPAGASLVRVNYDAFTHEEKEPKEKQVFSPLELAKLRKTTTDPFWLAAISIGHDTGLRLGDIAQLEWASFTGNRLIVWTEKADKRVDIPLTVDMVVAMTSIPKTDPVYCFPVQREIAIDLERRSGLSMQFTRLCARAGITGKSFHSLRHTNASELSTGGASMEEIAKRLGHTSTETTKGYVHGTPA